jgi:hypothetical protein
MFVHETNRRSATPLWLAVALALIGGLFLTMHVYVKPDTSTTEAKQDDAGLPEPRSSTLSSDLQLAVASPGRAIGFIAVIAAILLAFALLVYLKTSK